MAEAKLKRLHDLAVERGDYEMATRALQDIKSLRAAEPRLPDPADLPDRPETAMTLLRSFQNSLASGIDSGVDAAVSIATSAIAEPIAGMAGIATQNIFNPLPTPDERRENVNQVREAISVPPQTQGGAEVLQSLGEFVQPATDAMKAAETYLGDKTLDVTGSPLAASIATTVPAAGAELLGLGIGKRAANAVSNQARRNVDKKIDKELSEAAPTQSELKTESTKHFTELDNLGVTVKSDAYGDLVGNIEKALVKKGMDARVTPEAAGALDALKDVAERSATGEVITLSEIEVLREIASNAVDPVNPKKQALALTIVDEIDDFLESAGPEQFNMPKGRKPAEVGIKYKQARDQWGRFRKSEMLNEAIERAQTQASGFENGIRRQFDQILKNKKKAKFLNDSEITAMRQVVNGTYGANIFRLLGKFGFDIGSGNPNVLMGALTSVASFSTLEPITAVSTIVGASGARRLAERLTKQNAAFANQVIRAGTDARKIAEVYMRNTPKAQRSADELSVLLLNKNIDLSPLNRYKMEAEAARKALENRAKLAGAVGAGSNQRETTPVD